MKSLAMAQFTDVNLTALGLIIFLSFFAGVLIWTSLNKTKELIK